MIYLTDIKEFWSFLKKVQSQVTRMRDDSFYGPVLAWIRYASHVSWYLSKRRMAKHSFLRGVKTFSAPGFTQGFHSVCFLTISGPWRKTTSNIRQTLVGKPRGPYLPSDTSLLYQSTTYSANSSIICLSCVNHYWGIFLRTWSALATIRFFAANTFANAGHFFPENFTHFSVKHPGSFTSRYYYKCNPTYMNSPPFLLKPHFCIHHSN